MFSPVCLYVSVRVLSTILKTNLIILNQKKKKIEPNLSVVVNKRVRRCLLAEHEVRRGTGCYTNVAERLSARYRHGDVYRNAEPDIHWHAVCACH